VLLQFAWITCERLATTASWFRMSAWSCTSIELFGMPLAICCSLSSSACVGRGQLETAGAGKVERRHDGLLQHRDLLPLGCYGLLEDRHLHACVRSRVQLSLDGRKVAHQCVDRTLKQILLLQQSRQLGRCRQMRHPGGTQVHSRNPRDQEDKDEGNHEKNGLLIHSE
jgi:hypothetical protein